jgi:hypothetical protein
VSGTRPFLEVNESDVISERKIKVGRAETKTCLGGRGWDLVPNKMLMNANYLNG